MTDELSPQARALVDAVAAAAPSQKTPEFERLQESLFAVQVCTSLSDEEATTRVNLVPSGTSYGWRLTDEPNSQPVPCADRPETHRHLLFDC